MSKDMAAKAVSYGDTRRTNAKFMGSDSNSLCQILDDTSKGPGDRIRSILRVQLNGAGVQGDGTLEGQEEALSTYTDCFSPFAVKAA